MVKASILNFRIVLSLVMMAMVVLAHKVISQPSLRNSLAQVRVNTNKNKRKYETATYFCSDVPFCSGFRTETTRD